MTVHWLSVVGRHLRKASEREKAGVAIALGVDP